MLAALAVVGAGLTLWYTDRRHRLDRDTNATDRYTKAVEQLAHENIAVRLGGIYALSPNPPRELVRSDGRECSRAGSAVDVFGRA